MNRSGSAVRGGVLVPEHGDVVVVLTYNDDDEDDPWVFPLRWLRTGDCGGLGKEEDNARRVPRDFLGDNGAPRSEIMLVVVLLRMTCSCRDEGLFFCARWFPRVLCWNRVSRRPDDGAKDDTK